MLSSSDSSAGYQGVQDADNKVEALVTSIKLRCAGAKLLPDYGNYKFDGRYAVNSKGQITDLQTGLELLPNNPKGQTGLMTTSGQMSITNQRALALAFFGVKAVANKRVHLINSKLPLSVNNLQVCKSHKTSADGVHL